jgi:hypothetical protein
MKIQYLGLTIASVFFGQIAIAERTTAQQAVMFTCLAPSGHVCQIGVRTQGAQINFALPSGQNKEIAGLTPRVDTYCVCDPGPVTPDRKQPRLDLWCLGSWRSVQPGVNSENEAAKHLLARAWVDQQD